MYLMASWQLANLIRSLSVLVTRVSCSKRLAHNTPSISPSTMIKLCLTASCNAHLPPLLQVKGMLQWVRSSLGSAASGMLADERLSPN